jgi:hypothetical protein
MSGALNQVGTSRRFFDNISHSSVARFFRQPLKFRQPKKRSLSSFANRKRIFRDNCGAEWSHFVDEEAEKHEAQ